MGALGPMPLLALLLGVATVAAPCGYLGSAIGRQHKRRARSIFLLGFFCGSMAGAILRERRHRTMVLAAVSPTAGIAPRSTEMWYRTYRFAARLTTGASSARAQAIAQRLTPTAP